MRGKHFRIDYIIYGLLFTLISCTGVPKPDQTASEPAVRPVSADIPVSAKTADPATEIIVTPSLPEKKQAERNKEPEQSPPGPKTVPTEVEKTILPENAERQVPVSEPETGVHPVPPAHRPEQEALPAALIAPAAAEKEIVVSEEVYNDTFNQIEIFIHNLNETIRKGDYPTWLTYLTEEYKRKYDNSQVLAELSESPILKGREIKLKSIQDYFNFVVVPSRTGTLLNKIVFTGEDRIRAVTVVQEVPVILYSLRKENGIWKVATE